MTNKQNQEKAEPIHVPGPSYWPFVLALGLTIVMVGVLLNAVVSVIGLVISAVGLVITVFSMIAWGVSHGDEHTGEGS